MHLALVTDAWYPQVNGVVRTLDTVTGLLRQDGHEITILSHDGFRTVPLPTYPEIRIALLPYRRLSRMLDEAAPQAIHIATEGPVGFAAWRYCRRRVSSRSDTAAAATRQAASLALSAGENEQLILVAPEQPPPLVRRVELDLHLAPLAPPGALTQARRHRAHVLMASKQAAHALEARSRQLRRQVTEVATGAVRTQRPVSLAARPAVRAPPTDEYAEVQLADAFGEVPEAQGDLAARGEG